MLLHSLLDLLKAEGHAGFRLHVHHLACMITFKTDYPMECCAKEGAHKYACMYRAEQQGCLRMRVRGPCASNESPAKEQTSHIP